MTETPHARCLAVIPARAGSKGIPGKNLALVAGRPLLSYTIDAARAVPAIDRVIVSTDCPKIAKVAQSLGAEVPFLRPAEWATDDAPGRAVWQHAVRWMKDEAGVVADFSFYLQPTSPLRAPQDLERALLIQRSRDADWVVSVSADPGPSIWCQVPDADGHMPGFAEADLSQTQRQHQRGWVRPNGAVFLTRNEVLLTSDRLYTEKTFAMPMPAERSLDIDEPWDLTVAELILKHHPSVASRGVSNHFDVPGRTRLAEAST